MTIIFLNSRKPHNGIDKLPGPPPWRTFDDPPASERPLAAEERGDTFQAGQKEIDLVNAALVLRRALLVTGKPGTGKSSLAYAVAHELKLGTVLRWSITSRATLQQGLYQYDAIGRLRDANLLDTRSGAAGREQANNPAEIGNYIRLGPLGTALLPTRRPRALLIDELDKSDIDFPNDLLNVFEEGEYEIPELSRLKSAEPVPVQTHDGGTVAITGGRVRCSAFPFVVLTSNNEREFPPAFLRRCLRLEIPPPPPDKLRAIVELQLPREMRASADDLIKTFLDRRTAGDLATDQLLNAIYLTSQGIDSVEQDKTKFIDAVMSYLNSPDGL